MVDSVEKMKWITSRMKEDGDDGTWNEAILKCVDDEDEEMGDEIRKEVVGIQRENGRKEF